MTPDPRNEPLVWSSFTRSALGAAYNNTDAVAHSAQTLADLAARSVEVREIYSIGLDLVYGNLPRQKFDLFSDGDPNAPLLVFIHGGYWQRNSKDMFSAMAEGPLGAGFEVAVIGYTLAPEASLTEIISECEAAIRWLRRLRPGIRAGRRKLIVGGWSAGGHLAARLLEMPEVDGALAISGIFDLEPIRHCYLQDKLRLSAEEAVLQSPLHRLAETAQTQAGKPFTLTYGLAELPELRRQSEVYAAARAALGLPVRTIPLPGINHFSILDQLAKKHSPLATALAVMV